MKNRPLVAVVFGTRPEAIKLFPIIVELKKRKDVFPFVCVTAQHREMLDQIMKPLNIVPDVDLNLMKKKSNLNSFASLAIKGLHGIFSRIKPDLVLVQGDTTTAMCGAIAAFHCRIPIGHVEAGLRTWDLSAPWPEEMNRQVIARIASMHFAPTSLNRRNLLKENVSGKIYVTGNTGIDALRIAYDFIKRDKTFASKYGAIMSFRKKVLITTHRRENMGKPMLAIMKVVAKLCVAIPDSAFIFPVHLNPSVRETVKSTLRNKYFPNLFLMEPLPYLDFVFFLSKASIVLTDSGGVQEEGPYFGKRILVMREKTERPEAIATKKVQLIGTSSTKIYKTVCDMLEGQTEEDSVSFCPGPFGDGYSAERIVNICLKFLYKS